jgi:hypothetical protein
LLREIRRRSEVEYLDAVADYRESVVQGILQERTDPVQIWIAFGIRLAERFAPGRTLNVDGQAECRRREGARQSATWDRPGILVR